MNVSIRAPSSDREWEAYYDLRYRILREPLGKGRGSERDTGDATNIHVGIWENEKLVGIARVDQPEEHTSQVRFVAVDRGYQRQGYGTILMKGCERIARKRGDSRMILHARDYAVNWYEQKLNYSKVDDKPSYVLFGTLPHFEMSRDLFVCRTPANSVDWHALYDLRYRVLLQPLGRVRCGEERCNGDADGVHVCVWDNGLLRGCARVDKIDKDVSQIRYVAVEECVQREGYGSAVMRKAEDVVRARGDRKIILHARVTCVDFYQRKFHYRIVEKSYVLFDKLQHFLMEKYFE